jgi:hypothetical protein
MGHLLATLTLAPLIYFFGGLPWALITGRVRWAPLWGVGVLGIFAELSHMAGAPVLSVVVAAAVLHGIVGCAIVLRTDAAAEVRLSLVGFVGLYLLALVPLVATPFSLPGAWSGDWYVALESGLHILQASRFTSTLLARPPLFGAASVPMLVLGPTMAGFQAFCAVASACALQVFVTGLRRNAATRLVWILAGSVFFLQITANAWPKFMCAAFLLAAWQSLDSDAGPRPWVGGALFGLALATHQSALLFGPLLLTRCIAAPRARGIGRALVVAAVAAMVVAPWEIYILGSYGWTAVVQANPAVSARIQGMPSWLNALLVGVTTLVAWSPLGILRHWLDAADRLTWVSLEHHAYWIATEFCNSFAGSLLGLVLPWWVALGTGDLRRRFKGLLQGMDWPVKWALFLALLGQMLLNPYYSSGGSLQTGWVPVGLALSLWFANSLVDSPPAIADRAIVLTAWIGTFPWLAFNVALSAALVVSRGFRTQYFDSDLERLDQNHWVALGMGGFPWLQVLLAVALLLLTLRGTKPGERGKQAQGL